MRYSTLFLTGALFLALSSNYACARSDALDSLSTPRVASAQRKGSTPPVVLPDIARQFRVNVKKDCGAKGDGKTNDTFAFQKAAQLLMEKGGGTLMIPKATYIVGQQIHEAGKYPFYKSQPMFSVEKLNGLLIEGSGATLRLAPGLRFGSFDKDTGEVYKPKMPFVDRDYLAMLGNVIYVENCRNVVIRDLEIDGNLGNLVLGGEWGDSGRQVPASGLMLANSANVHLDKVHSYHNALDGAVIGATVREGDAPTPHTLIDCSFEYNGRQGLSWIGGIGLRAIRCKFNHTGRAKIGDLTHASPPGAGLDIEAEQSICRDGYFEDCEFINNYGAGMVADSGDGGYSKFKNCTFWGTTNWSAWSCKPGLKYEDCKFYGSAVHAVGSPDPALATSWTRCHFEDKPWKDGKVYRQNSASVLVELNGKLENVRFNECTFVANTCRSLWVVADPEGRATLSACTIIHKKADLPDKTFQGLFGNVIFEGTRFKEEFPPDATQQWYVSSEWAVVKDGVVVDGPRVKWRNWRWGTAGRIEPSTPEPGPPKT